MKHLDENMVMNKCLMLISTFHQKHQNEFNESAALRELYKYMLRYFSEVRFPCYDRSSLSCIRGSFTEQFHRIFRHFEATEILKRKPILPL